MHASRHSCDHEASSADAMPFADQSIAFSSMPPDRYPRSRCRPDGTRRRTQNEWLAGRAKEKVVVTRREKETVEAEAAQSNGKGKPRDRDKEERGRPAGSPALSAGKIGKKIASETAVGTETAALGRTGPGKTTDPPGGSSTQPSL